MSEKRGRILLLNGTSSSGKSTLAAALRPRLGMHFHYYASDQLAGSGFRPVNEGARWECRAAFFSGFHRSIAAFASAGLDLLVEHIVEEPSWAEELHRMLSPYIVLWVGVHAPVNEVIRREQLRGDRRIGEALEHLKTHSFCKYDIEVDSTHPPSQNAETVLAAWERRTSAVRL